MKVLQKQLAMAMKEMIEDTGAPLIKKMETLRQIINFSIAMCPNGGKEELRKLRDEFSTLIVNEYQPSFEDPEINLSNEELIFRIKLEDLHGDASIVINEQKLIPAYFMDSVIAPKFGDGKKDEDEM
jgi:hypothetical protein